MLSASTNGALVAPFPINTNVYIPFPTLQYTSTNLPYIGFSPDGMLVDVSGAPLGDQYIALTSGGIFYLRDDVGGLMYQPPLITESPAGEWTNNPTLIHIDATTARAQDRTQPVLMNLTALQPDQSRLRRQRRGARGFTMIEIAISIGVIGFALVAIIGILPSGMTVQKDNRQDTIINQDANFFMQAIRRGAVVTNGSVLGRSVDFLTNHLDVISITNQNFNPSLSFYREYSNSVGPGFFPMANEANQSVGNAALGLLCTPAFYASSLGIYPPASTNYVRAWVRALNGSALEQNGSNSVVAFRYIMDVQITPHYLFPEDSTNYFAYTAGTTDCLNRSNRWVQAQSISRNLYDVQLTFHWPVLAGNAPGPNHQIFRSTIAACMTNFGVNPTYYYFQPSTFTTVALQ